jgi:hypothetical protein
MRPRTKIENRKREIVKLERIRDFHLGSLLDAEQALDELINSTARDATDKPDHGVDTRTLVIAIAFRQARYRRPPDGRPADGPVSADDVARARELVEILRIVDS